MMILRSSTVALLMFLLLLTACQSTSTPIESAPVPEPATDEVKTEHVTVDASALNMRNEPSMDGEIVTQIKRGERLELIEEGSSWTKVRLPDGTMAWAASRFLLREGQQPRSRRSRGNCPADSDFAFLEAPVLSFSDSDKSGTVVVEAHVSAAGRVLSTKVIENSTGDPALAAQTEREIGSAEFIAPVRNCRSRDFIYTYRRNF